jgi:hypothetical protein
MAANVDLSGLLYGEVSLGYELLHGWVHLSAKNYTMEG